MEEVVQLAGWSLPPMGPFALNGHLEAFGQGIRLSGFTAALGHTSLGGDLEIVLGSGRPRLFGRLTGSALDPTPFILSTNKRTEDQPGDPATSTGRGDQTSSSKGISLAFLRVFDLHLNLGLEKIIGLPTEISGISAQIALDNGLLTASLDMNLGGTPIDGIVTVDAGAEVPKFHMKLEAADTTAADKEREKYKIHAGSIEFDASAQGKSLPPILESLAINLEVGEAFLAYGSGTGKLEKRLILDGIQAVLSPRRGLTANVKGTVLERPFSLTLTGGNLAGWLNKAPWPLKARFDGEGAGPPCQRAGRAV